MKRELRSTGAPLPAGPYSQAIEAGVVYCAGQIGIDPATGKLAEGIEAQTERAILNLNEVLKSGGLGLGDVVKTTVFLSDMAEYSAMNDAYAKHFEAPFPARSTVQAAALPRGARVEIDAVAVKRTT